ncbi:MAG TPA: tryptophan halogenase family protein [Gammaproteobacteria bacterium]|nr:tryptophan halogenase family protein [Gammaproteobacteria bacterium]
MHSEKVKKVVVTGGGTAGWVAAAALSKKLGPLLDITLVESEAIGTVGVGEATIPPMRVFHKVLGIDEQEFMRTTKATFKLGIYFDNWGQKGDIYIHSFGENGRSTWLADFHHFWLHSLERGYQNEIGDYCYELQAAKAGRFATSPESKINFAYHLDAGIYAKYLRKFSEACGVKRVEGKIQKVNQNADTGFIESLTLDNGRNVEGDLFIDCTGFRGLLIEQTLKSGYEDWSHWLPCDSALPLQTESVGPAAPFTRSTAHDFGWQWCIPLQHRVGNGLVYCSQYASDDWARDTLLANIEGKVLTEPRVIKFKTGRRRIGWSKNCVALGLASGFVEPLESTSIHLVITGVTRLMQLFPFNGITRSLVDQYNERSRNELESIRDFIILHYHATEREDTEFWRYCKNMQVPESLTHRMNLFREYGHAYQGDGELFRVDSWTQVMLGQRIRPKQYHPLPRMMTDKELSQLMNGMKESIMRAVSKLPSHQDFVDQYCKAGPWMESA